MDKGQILKELCREIAGGDVSSLRFNSLLLEAGMTLGDDEWDTANRLLGKSEEMLSCYEKTHRTKH